MYALLGIGTVVRIAAAMLVLFVLVPALAIRRPRALTPLQWFWWCLGAGIVLLTLLGQLLTLLNVYSGPTLLLAIAALVVLVRARVTHTAPVTLLHDAYRAVVFVALNVLEGRIHLRRRFRRGLRRGRQRLNAALAPSRTRWTIAGWSTVAAVAALTRFYRPFATANLGFSDTYVHLYLVRLLEQGRQVDPAWGPYPRGMHFLLLAIHELTNVDEILLMNFFGAAAGVLMCIAVADAARRLSRSLAAGLLSGLLFATMIGGASQYFLLGGSFVTDNVPLARTFVRLPYADVPDTAADFDVLLTSFERQTATLPQELAIVLLFPAALFLFSACHPERSEGPGRAGGAVNDASGLPHPPSSLADARDDMWWHLAGFIACAAAIAAVHPGVVVPLVILCAVSAIAARPPLRVLRNGIAAGAAGIAIGSTWMLAFILYPYTGASHMNVETVGSGSNVGSTALYYFPLLRGLARDPELARIRTWVAITPFVLLAVVLIVFLLVRAKWSERAPLVWTALAALAFLITHTASRFGLPELVEIRRNVTWLAMALAILVGVSIAELARLAARIEIPSRFALRPAVAALLVGVWMLRVPLFAAGVREKLVNYSGWGATAYAVLAIQQRFEPFTWTLITYGQEYPMVLGKGFHLAAADFLERFDPNQGELAIPTRLVFIAVEKNPHPFQINNWARQFSRADLEQRLQTWCFLYQLSHRNMRVYLDDANVRVFMIERSQDEANHIARTEAGR